MKKCVLLFVILFMLMILPAQAEPQSELHFDYGHGALTVDVEGLMADSSYFLLVTSGSGSVEDAILPQNILFMDMVASNSDGALNIGLVSMDVVPGSSVLLGGPFEDVMSPYTVGTVEHNTAIPLPGKLTAIEAEAFMRSGFTSVYIGTDVTSIGDRAFKDCASLRTVWIANDNMVFGEDVFDGCTDVVIVCSQNSTAPSFAMLYDNVTVRYQ